MNAKSVESISRDSLGELVRETRRRKGMTLEQISARTGIGRSTLSKIENGKTRPSFDIVRRLSEVLELTMPQLFAQSATAPVSGRRSITPDGGGAPRETKTYRHELLCDDLLHKGMLPYVSTIKARDFSDFDDWIRHEGEEFMYVLSGSVTLHTEHYAPVSLNEGDSIYYDSGMGHCVVSTSRENAKVLWVSLER